MIERQIRKLSTDGLYEHRQIHGRLIETHISWVVLSDNHAFKIKKPLKFSFLNFSTLQLRKKFCLLELRLNRRLTDIYQTVLPVRYHKGLYIIGGRKGQILDYAVVMKRVNPDLQMDSLLRAHKVTTRHITALARSTASFHQKARIIKTSFKPEVARNLFNEIGDFSDFLTKSFGRKHVSMIHKAIGWSDKFLELYDARFRERITLGYKRDVHGDLHSGNVFLLKRPVIFDCIDFNKHYRQIDLLYEIAFMAMDLDSFGYENLSKLFVREYLKKFPVIRNQADRAILHYFKCLRANVRAKVHLISLSQADTSGEVTYHSNRATKYLQLIQRYCHSFDLEKISFDTD
jgi:aminoglycoside phosphotransferase family enzyme